jgi:hypothetical protein
MTHFFRRIHKRKKSIEFFYQGSGVSSILYCKYNIANFTLQYLKYKIANDSFDATINIVH